jgi:hypothetical protein
MCTGGFLILFYLDRLVEFYKAVIMARDITRFMRWPGSFNLKYTPVRQSKILFQSDEVLHVDKVMAFPNKKQST